MVEYDYPKQIKEHLKLLPELEGAILKDVIVQVVKPEFNIVYFSTNKGIFEIFGQIGGEFLGIRQASKLPKIEKSGAVIHTRYPEYELFLNRRISQVRQIGEAWNGHGLEFSFEGIFDRTIIIQSIYTGSKPDDLEDCLKLGIGVYSHLFEDK